ncbi:MAG: HNH endonuclease signature motif containing protein [Cyanobacteria bacterium P01_A01_bin.17]
MVSIPASLRRLVIQRAENRCEYCGLSQLGQAATFHIDHVIPVVAGGLTAAENLALACVAYSLYKGAKQVVEDPKTGRTVAIFNPRQQVWADHFYWDNAEVVGVTSIGRATISTLKLNRALILAIRVEEELLNRHPPP